MVQKIPAKQTRNYERAAVHYLSLRFKPYNLRASKHDNQSLQQIHEWRHKTALFTQVESAIVDYRQVWQVESGILGKRTEVRIRWKWLVLARASEINSKYRPS